MHLKNLKTNQRINVLSSYRRNVFVKGSKTKIVHEIDCLVTREEVGIVKQNKLKKKLVNFVLSLHDFKLIEYVKVINWVKPLDVSDWTLPGDFYSDTDKYCILKCKRIDNFGLLKEYAKWHHSKK